MEMNLSETAFVSLGWTKGQKLTKTAPDSQVERRTLRWFTPTNEVPLCGHATVASAKAIFSLELNDTDKKTISFESKFRGKLGATLNENDGRIILNFPSNPTHSLNLSEHSSWVYPMIEATLGSQDDVVDIQYSPGSKVLLLRLKDTLGPQGLREVKPDFKAMMEIDTNKFIHDIIVTVKGSGKNGEPDFYSRFFAPWDGVDEDPVCGMAHTVMTPYWTKVFEGKKTGTLYARQHSTRGGDLMCTLLGDRVQLAGSAKISLKGEIYI
jgi:PhzF family phenazine biosynthesis protein